MRLLLALALCGLAGCGQKTEPGKASSPSVFADAAELRKAAVGATADEARSLFGSPDSIGPLPGSSYPETAVWHWKQARVGGKDVPLELVVEQGRVTRVERVGEDGLRDGGPPRRRDR